VTEGALGLHSYTLKVVPNLKSFYVAYTLLRVISIFL
jgi:hypothetical protein